jgi:hypothetical protein
MRLVSSCFDLGSCNHSNCACSAPFLINKVDGKMLLRIDEKFAKEHLDITNGILCRKLCRKIAFLKKTQLKFLKVLLSAYRHD